MSSGLGCVACSSNQIHQYTCSLGPVRLIHRIRKCERKTQGTQTIQKHSSSRSGMHQEKWLTVLLLIWGILLSGYWRALLTLPALRARVLMEQRTSLSSTWVYDEEQRKCVTAKENSWAGARHGSRPLWYPTSDFRHSYEAQHSTRVDSCWPVSHFKTALRFCPVCLRAVSKPLGILLLFTQGQFGSVGTKWFWGDSQAVRDRSGWTSDPASHPWSRQFCVYFPEVTA